MALRSDPRSLEHPKKHRLTQRGEGINERSQKRDCRNRAVEQTPGVQHYPHQQQKRQHARPHERQQRSIFDSHGWKYDRLRCRLQGATRSFAFATNFVT